MNNFLEQSPMEHHPKPMERNPNLDLGRVGEDNKTGKDPNIVSVPLTTRADEMITNPSASINPQPAGVSQTDTAHNLFGSNNVPRELGRVSTLETMRGLFKSCRERMGKLLENPALTKLDHEKNARFDPISLVDRLILKHKDPEKILAAVENLFLNDERFNNSNKELFEFSGKDKDAVLKLLKEAVERQPPKETQKPKDQNVPEDPEKQRKLEKDIGFDLVGLVTRTPTKVKVNDHTDVVQTHGHVENNTFIPGRAVSANLGNTEQKLTEIPNQAVVATDKEVWVNRSARTNTKDKIFDKSTAGIEGMLKTTSHAGLKPALDSDGKPVLDPNQRPIYVTCRSDVTLMDLSPAKSLYTTVKSGATSMVHTMKSKRGIPVESERAFVQSKREMAHAHWKENGKVGVNGRYYIDRQMKMKDTNGVEKEVCVREYEPLVFNFAFSAQAKIPANVKAAREDNIPGAISLLKDWAQLNQKPELLKYSQLLKSDPPSKFELDQLKAFIQADINNGSLTKKEDLALRGLLITLTGKDIDGTDFDNVGHADEQFIFLCHLSDVAQSPISVECKSGNDRTATAVCLRCAQKEFEENHGRPYDPTNRTDFNQFKDLFNKYMVELTPPNLRASRGLGEEGRPDVKSKTSPAARKYLDMDKIKDVLNVV